MKVEIAKYWMCKQDEWDLIPHIRFTIEKESKTKILLGVSIGWLKRWFAFEVLMDIPGLVSHLKSNLHDDH